MPVIIHPHALERAKDRGTTENEITETIESGESFPAKHDRTGFRKTVIYNAKWQHRHYYAKQIECYTVRENDSWVGITVLVKYF